MSGLEAFAGRLCYQSSPSTCAMESGFDRVERLKHRQTDGPW